MNRILVTGANGTIGQPLVAALRARGAELSVMTSRRNAPAVPGQRTVHGDFADPASLRAAFEGIDTLFLLFPMVPGKVQLARNAVAAAQAAGVRHIVRSSGAGADAASPVAIARLQGEIDALVAASGIPFTILMPSFFMQNWLGHQAAAVQAGTYQAAHGQGAMSLVDARDVADAAAAVLAEPAAHAGRRYTLTGAEALTDAQQVALIAAATGRPLAYADVPPADVRAGLEAASLPAVMIDWLCSLDDVVRQGWGGGITGDVAALAGHAPRRFADFVAEHRAAWA